MVGQHEGGGHATLADVPPVIPKPKNQYQAARVAMDDAVSLICDVRDIDPHDVWDNVSSWSPTRIVSCLIALAAAHPDDKPLEESLSWVRSLA